MLLDTTLQVRIGEWKVLDTNRFDRKNCYYYDSKTEAQCDGARVCRRRCRLQNDKIDCIPSSQGQEVCSEEVQVNSCQQWEIKNYLYTRLKAASQLHLPSCRDLQIGSTKVTSTSDWVNKGNATFSRSGRKRWHHLWIGSRKVTSPSDWVKKGYIIFGSGQKRWHNVWIGSIKVTSPLDSVHQSDITFRLGQ